MALSCLTHGMQGSQMWAHSALFGMDGLLMAFGGTHLVLLSMSRMPWDTEAEGELVVGLSVAPLLRITVTLQDELVSGIHLDLVYLEQSLMLESGIMHFDAVYTPYS